MDEEFEKKHEERMRKEIEVNILISQLSTTNSPIGDWKVIKCYEAKLKGEPMPYDVDELMTERQKVRDRINELQAELAEEDA